MWGGPCGHQPVPLIGGSFLATGAWMGPWGSPGENGEQDWRNWVVENWPEGRFQRIEGSDA